MFGAPILQSIKFYRQITDFVFTNEYNIMYININTNNTSLIIGIAN